MMTLRCSGTNWGAPEQRLATRSIRADLSTYRARSISVLAGMDTLDPLGGLEQGWPTSGERGVIYRLGDGTAHVV